MAGWPAHRHTPVPHSHCVPIPCPLPPRGHCTLLECMAVTHGEQVVGRAEEGAACPCRAGPSHSMPVPQCHQWVPLCDHHLQHLRQPGPLRSLPLLLRHTGAAQSLQPRPQVLHGQVRHLPFLLARSASVSLVVTAPVPTSASVPPPRVSSFLPPGCPHPCLQNK